MAKVQKVSTREFKEQAVQLAQTSGKPIVRSYALLNTETDGVTHGLAAS